MFNIVEYLSNYVSIETMNEHNITFDCPFCGRGERHFNVSVLKQKPVYNCYSCGAKGNWTYLISNISGVSYKEAKGIVYGLFDYIHVEEKREEVKIHFPPNTGWSLDSLEYLKSRRITKKLAESLGWYFCNDGKYRDRIILPIYKDNIPITFQARTIRSDVGLRYTSPYRSPIGDIVYGIDSYKPNKRLILVEGIFDAVNLLSMYPCVGATFTKRVTDGQIRCMVEKGVKKVGLMFDPDSIPNISEMWYKLSGIFDVSIIPLFDKDPAEIEDCIEFDIIMGDMVESIHELEDLVIERL
jgi:DNA primase